MNSRGSPQLGCGATAFPGRTIGERPAGGTDDRIFDVVRHAHLHSEGHAVVAALAVVTAMLGAMLAAAPADAQSGGERTVKVPYDLAAFGGIGFDPTTVPSPADWYVQQWIYDSLLRQNADGSYSPGLAKSAKVVDPQTIQIDLRPNQKFSDGTPVDADAVKFSIERSKASGNVGAIRAELNQISDITVESPTRLTISLATPVAGQFFNLLANGETYIVSPTAAQSGTSLDEKPVGAGPFVLDSFTPESSAVFVRNKDFIDNKKVKIDRIELVQVARRPDGSGDGERPARRHRRRQRHDACTVADRAARGRGVHGRPGDVPTRRTTSEPSARTSPRSTTSRCARP